MKMEWKVPIHIHLALFSPTRVAMRPFISLAAFLVKVSARISPGAAPQAIAFAILQVSTRVFPAPAPAMIRHGPSMLRTASAWASLSSSNM